MATTKRVQQRVTRAHRIAFARAERRAGLHRRAGHPSAESYTAWHKLREWIIRQSIGLFPAGVR